MALFTPVLDWAAAGLWMVGSPALGYIVLRAAWPSCQAWSGSLRGVVSFVLGVGWSLLALTILSPGVSNPAPLHANQIAEFSGALGMGVILFTLFAGLISRFVWYRYIVPWNPGMMPPAAMVQEERVSPVARPRLPPAPARTVSNLRAPTIETGDSSALPKPAPSPTPLPPRVYKPSQLKVTLPRAEEKSLGNGSEDDVLGLLRDEAASEGRPVERPAERADRPAPISQLGDFAGFDDTLTQLKRDLKAFNESVDVHSRKKTSGP